HPRHEKGGEEDEDVGTEQEGAHEKVHAPINTPRPWDNRRRRMAMSDSDGELRAELERLRAENERLRGQRARGVTLKVSEKGGVSVYGLGRFPVTLYKWQWSKLLDMADEIRAFIKAHDAELKSKPQ